MESQSKSISDNQVIADILSTSTLHNHIVVLILTERLVRNVG
ncbi:hypothetical protein SDC9_100180 [bioreactor metagenome]|uniref:Uncharacterized protein n=1 Tax=bioreactor metagenome TaxID=1076179 RepID=A0A645AJL8_9ZZZZ